jgi:hypothetical protein
VCEPPRPTQWKQRSLALVPAASSSPSLDAIRRVGRNRAVILCRVASRVMPALSTNMSIGPLLIPLQRRHFAGKCGPAF